jgi:hypothetical protein
MRQYKNVELLSDSIGSESALDHDDLGSIPRAQSGIAIELAQSARAGLHRKAGGQFSSSRSGVASDPIASETGSTFSSFRNFASMSIYRNIEIEMMSIPRNIEIEGAKWFPLRVANSLLSIMSGKILHAPCSSRGLARLSRSAYSVRRRFGGSGLGSR